MKEKEEIEKRLNELKKCAPGDSYIWNFPIESSLELVDIKRDVILIISASIPRLLVDNSKLRELRFEEGFCSKEEVKISRSHLGKLKIEGDVKICNFFVEKNFFVGELSIHSGQYDSILIWSNLLIDKLYSSDRVKIKEHFKIDNSLFGLAEEIPELFISRETKRNPKISNIKIRGSDYTELKISHIVSDDIYISGDLTQDSKLELLKLKIKSLIFFGLSSDSTKSRVSKVTFGSIEDDNSRSHSLEIKACRLGAMQWKDISCKGRFDALIDDSQISEIRLLRCHLPEQLVSKSARINQLGYRQLKMICTNHGYISDASEYFVKEMSSYTVAEKADIKHIEFWFWRLLRYLEWVFVVWLNNKISGFGKKFLRPVWILIGFHILMAQTMYFYLCGNFSLGLDFWEIYFVTLLPTHKFSFGPFVFSPIISFFMRLINSVLIYHIVRGSRQLIRD